MKTFLITCAFVCISLLSFSQTIYQIRADSVRIYNTCDTAELILENRTQNVPGFLYNKGKGRTEFRKLTFDTTLILGAYKNNEAGDSVLTTDANGVVKFVHKSTLGGGGSSSNIYTTDGTLTGDRTLTGGAYKLTYSTGPDVPGSPPRLTTEWGADAIYRANATYNGNYATMQFLGLSFSVAVNSGPTPTGAMTGLSLSPTQISLSARPAGSNMSRQALYVNTNGNMGIGTEFVRSGYQFDVVATSVFERDVRFFTALTLDSYKNNASGDNVLTTDADGLVKLKSSLPAVTTITGSKALTGVNYTVLADNSSDIGITLPTAAANTGRIYFIKKISTNTNTVTVLPSGSDKIDGSPSYVINSANKCIQIQSNGSSWYILTVM